MRNRKIDIAFLSEIWETEGDLQRGLAMDKMCELDGFDYVSCPRPTRGGCAALVVNTLNYSIKKVNIPTPPHFFVK